MYLCIIRLLHLFFVFSLQAQQLTYSIEEGVIISNQSLVLQKVTREQAGSYTCEASNVEGDQVSNPVRVSIMCKCFIRIYSYIKIGSVNLDIIL